MIIDDDNQNYISDHSSIDSINIHETHVAKPVGSDNVSENKFKLSAFITSSGKNNKIND